MSEHDQVRVEVSDKRVRPVFAGVVVADTTRPTLVWERPHYPTYYFSEDAVRMDLLVPTGERHVSARGDAEVLSVQVGDRTAVGAVRHYRGSPVAALTRTVRIRWDAMDAWFEEDDEVFVHARDPYTRIDILQSSRHVRIEVDGATVAESHRPRLLFETGLPVRTYLPKIDVRLDLLVPSGKVTRCPYKGDASYHSVDVDGHRYEDIAWSYRHPTPEAVGIAGYVCFHDDRVDTYVDAIAMRGE